MKQMLDKRCWLLLALLIMFYSLTSYAEIELGAAQEKFFTAAGSNTPNGISRKPISGECSPQQLFLKAGNGVPSFVGKCESQMRASFADFELLRMSQNSFQPLDRHNYQHMIINFPDGSRLQAILALKPTMEKRPLVIVRGGLFAPPEFEMGGALLAQHLYEDGQFHFLYVESVSSLEYSQNNSRMAIGGLIEGLQNVKIIGLLEQSKLAERISEYHIAGISLGGHGALFSSIYGSYLTGKKRPRSVLAVCPVVDLNTSLQQLTEVQLMGFDPWSELTGILKGVAGVVPPIGEMFSTKKNFTPKDLISTSLRATMTYVDKSWPKIRQRPFDKLELGSLDKFMAASNFVKQSRFAKIPTLVVHAANDEIVSHRSNLQALQEQGIPNDKLQLVTLQKGNHCAFAQGYQWKHMSNLFNGFLAAHSQYQPKILHFPIMNSVAQWTGLLGIKAFQLSENEVIVGYNFTNFDEEGLTLAVRVFAGGRTLHRPDEVSYCRDQSPLEADYGCYREITGRLKLNMGQLGLPSEAQEARVLRYLNSNGYLVDHQGKELIGTHQVPHTLLVRAY